jgi:hypothetical protein
MAVAIYLISWTTLSFLQFIRPEWIESKEGAIDGRKSNKRNKQHI